MIAQAKKFQINETKYCNTFEVAFISLKLHKLYQ